MKKIITLLAIVFCLNAKAQYVTIPDTAFVNWLTINFPYVMNGNLMDTTKTIHVQQMFIQNTNIYNLDGVQYFDSLTLLLINNNNPHIYNIPKFPPQLIQFAASNNSLTTLPPLPNTLVALQCDGNQLTSLPALPPNLQGINCNSNNITALPSLPSTLQALTCTNNLLTSLPLLPSALGQLNCDYNQITYLPYIPSGVYGLTAQHNQLSNCPNLPNGLQVLDLSYNNISCFSVFPASLNSVVIIPNPFNCIPNYVYSMDAATLGYPLCLQGNSNGCVNATGAVGYTYKDNNSDCTKNAGDLSLINVPLQLLDTNNNQLALTYSSSNGVYDFSKSSGKYKIKVDTVGKPFTIQCQHPGIDSMFIINNANQLDSNVNFSFTCKPGFDIGVQSILVDGIVFPGTQHELLSYVGDMMGWYNLNCANGISGQVQITVTGNVTYVSPAINALTPTVVGNVYTYTIADFGAINNVRDFNLLFNTDSTATLGDTICVSINVTTIGGDNNMNNNNLHFCYIVSNSYDPNYKEVYPINVAPNYQEWFTYTIHFENTGNAPAMTVRVADVLDTKLDLNTFQVVNYSHPNITTLNGNIASFSFQNINLPDSNSNLLASQGFIQYRIKPIANLPNGTKIKNTADIYFDYNSAIVTNTTTNTFTTSVTSIKELSTKNNIVVYPNPTNNDFVVETNNTNKQTLQLFDINGKLVLTQIIIGKTVIDVNNLHEGVYSVSIIGNNVITNKKLVIIR